MSLTPADEALISFYFRATALFARSTFGAQLQRAHNAHKSHQESWAWRPFRDPLVAIKGDAGGSGAGYEVEHEDLMRFSAASRRMDEVGRRDSRSYAVLAAYYGDRGAKWASIGAGRSDPDNPSIIISAGAGPGSIASLYIMTEAGQQLVRREREVSERMRSGAGKAGKRKAEVDEEAQRRVSVDEALARRKAEAVELHAERSHAHRALLGVKAREAEARAAGKVPASLRSEKRDATNRLKSIDSRVDELERVMRLLRDQQTWKASKFRGPRVDEEPERIGPPLADGTFCTADLPSPLEGPKLPDDRFFTDITVSAEPPAIARIRAHRPPEPDHLTDDTVLEVAFLLQGERPNQHRGQRLAAARDQADALLLRAWGAWLATAKPGKERGAAQRKAKATSYVHPAFARGAA